MGIAEQEIISERCLPYILMKGGEMEKFEKKLDFELERETKNTYRYKETTQGTPVVQTLYVAKWALPSPAPQKIEVAIK